jgi:hypothetical protein
VISPVIGLCCHRHLADWQPVRARLGRHASTKFDASVEASGPHDFAVRNSTVRRSRPGSLTASRPAFPLRASAAAAIASCPAFVTIAIRPSVGQDGAAYRSDLGASGTDLFLRKGLDGFPLICPSGNGRTRRCGLRTVYNAASYAAAL